MLDFLIVWFAVSVVSMFITARMVGSRNAKIRQLNRELTVAENYGDHLYDEVESLRKDVDDWQKMARLYEQSRNSLKDRLSEIEAMAKQLP